MRFCPASPAPSSPTVYRYTIRHHGHHGPQTAPIRDERQTTTLTLEKKSPVDPATTRNAMQRERNRACHRPPPVSSRCGSQARPPRTASDITPSPGVGRRDPRLPIPGRTGAVVTSTHQLRTRVHRPAGTSPRSVRDRPGGPPVSNRWDNGPLIDFESDPRLSEADRADMRSLAGGGAGCSTATAVTGNPSVASVLSG